MGDPVTLGWGLAALAGGTAIQSKTQARRQERADDAASAQYLLERERQDSYAGEKEALYQEALTETTGRENMDADMEAAAAERIALQEQNSALPASADEGYTSPVAGNISNVQSRFEENRAEADAELDQKFGALAKLRSMGDTLQAYSLFRQPIAHQMNAIGQFSQRSSQLAPNEAALAAREAADWGHGRMLVGNIMSGLGSAMIGAGAMGGAGAAAGGAGGTTVGGATTAATSSTINPYMAASLFGGTGAYSGSMNAYGGHYGPRT